MKNVFKKKKPHMLRHDMLWNDVQWLNPIFWNPVFFFFFSKINISLK